MFGQLDPYARDPSIHIVSTLGPEVYKYYPHWAIWIPRVRADSAPSFTRPTRFQNQSSNLPNKRSTPFRVCCLGFRVTVEYPKKPWKITFLCEEPILYGVPAGLGEGSVQILRR